MVLSYYYACFPYIFYPSFIILQLFSKKDFLGRVAANAGPASSDSIQPSILKTRRSASIFKGLLPPFTHIEFERQMIQTPLTADYLYRLFLQTVDAAWVSFCFCFHS